MQQSIQRGLPLLIIAEAEQRTARGRSPEGLGMSFALQPSKPVTLCPVASGRQRTAQGERPSPAAAKADGGKGAVKPPVFTPLQGLPSPSRSNRCARKALVRHGPWPMASLSASLECNSDAVIAVRHRHTRKLAHLLAAPRQAQYVLVWARLDRVAAQAGGQYDRMAWTDRPPRHIFARAVTFPSFNAFLSQACSENNRKRAHGLTGVVELGN